MDDVTNVFANEMGPTQGMPAATVTLILALQQDEQEVLEP